MMYANFALSIKMHIYYNYSKELVCLNHQSRYNDVTATIAEWT